MCNMKQCIPMMKPHKGGYKLFILACVSGFAYNVQMFSRQKNDAQLHSTRKPDLGASSNIVV